MEVGGQRRMVEVLPAQIRATQVEAQTGEAGLLRRPGAALDLAMGQGRNAIYLAQQRWRVTGVDISPSAVALAGMTVAPAAA